MRSRTAHRSSADAPARRPPVPPIPRLGWLAAAVLALAVAVTASVAFGARAVSWHDVLGALGGDADGMAEAAVRTRIPRTLLAVLVGAALGLSGLVLQGVTRNPLADPGLLGISPGAALAVVVGIAFFGLRSPTSYLWVAIAGAFAAAVIVYAMGSLGRGRPTPLTLALAGAASWASFTSLTSAILLPRVDVMNVFRFWQIGGVGGADTATITPALAFLAVGALICLGSVRGLDALALGDDVAAGLGGKVTRTRLVAASGAVILCGAATAVAGPIAFVGLIVPHLSRLLVGVGHRWLVAFTAVTGAALLTVSDVVGRVVARPGEIEAGIVTAFVGAPVLIAIVRRQKVRAL